MVLLEHLILIYKKNFADLKKSSTLTSFQKLKFHATTLSVNRKRPTCVLK